MTIYDCFMFYNEFDLLELRLHTLADVVGQFVLVEGTETLQGKEKQLFYEENSNRFENFHDKITHIITDFPDDFGSSWEREYYLRNSIADGLTDCSQEDTVMVSDIDEIPQPQYVEKYAQTKGIKVFGLRFFYYFFNNLITDKLFPGTVMTNAESMSSPQEMRNIAMKNVNLEMVWKIPFASYPFWLQSFLMSVHASLATRKLVMVVPYAGWHFSYLGDVDTIVEKIESFAHTEANTAEYKVPGQIRERMEAGEDLYDRDQRMEFVNIDETFPRYLRENRDRFDRYIKH